MQIKQFFDKESSTYTYLIISAQKNAAIIDPVFDQIPTYSKLIHELNINLGYSIDTHIHADHRSASAQLNNDFGCTTINGSKKANSSMQTICHHEVIFLDEIEIKAIYTPGHTDDSFCFLVSATEPNIVFTGDTLLIRGNGRTDFQNGNPDELYDSITNELFTLDEQTIVYPGHDYNGNVSSTIFEEKNFNPRVANKTKKEFVQIMNSLDLPSPKLMDVVIPLNENSVLDI
ncbi:MBL fold metallo-hydrolase [Gammaproteobacteria bacterium]|nr:MBL fold metallo-hydrolase [Gammaproteobacteria bacterium]